MESDEARRERKDAEIRLYARALSALYAKDKVWESMLSVWGRWDRARKVHYIAHIKALAAEGAGGPSVAKLFFKTVELRLLS